MGVSYPRSFHCFRRLLDHDWGFTTTRSKTTRRTQGLRSQIKPVLIDRLCGGLICALVPNWHNSFDWYPNGKEGTADTRQFAVPANSRIYRFSWLVIRSPTVHLGWSAAAAMYEGMRDYDFEPWVILHIRKWRRWEKLTYSSLPQNVRSPGRDHSD